MTNDELEEIAANVRVLIREEMDVQHRLGGHPEPVPDCPLCRTRTPEPRAREPAGWLGLGTASSSR